MENMISDIVQIALGGAIAVIGYFLKKTIDKQDTLAPKESVNECKKEINKMRDDFATRRELDEIKQDIQGINKKIDYLSEHAVRNSDFIRTMTRIEDKIDDIRGTR